MSLFQPKTVKWCEGQIAKMTEEEKILLDQILNHDEDFHTVLYAILLKDMSKEGL